MDSIVNDLGSCEFKGCVYPAIWRLRDINADISVCQEHAQFLDLERGEFVDSSIGESFYEHTLSSGVGRVNWDEDGRTDDGLRVMRKTAIWNVPKRSHLLASRDRFLERMAAARRRQRERENEELMRIAARERRQRERGERLAAFVDLRRAHELNCLLRECFIRHRERVRLESMPPQHRLKIASLQETLTIKKQIFSAVGREAGYRMIMRAIDRVNDGRRARLSENMKLQWQSRHDGEKAIFRQQRRTEAYREAYRQLLTEIAQSG